MAFVQLNYLNDRPLAFLSAAEGNVPALTACLHQARRQGAQIRIFLGNAFGAFGHSDEVLYLLETQCTRVLKGQHEHLLLEQYSGADRASGINGLNRSTLPMYSQLLLRARLSLHPLNRRLIAHWPDLLRIQTPHGALLACFETPEQHGLCPLNRDHLNRDQIRHWLQQYKAEGMVIGSDHQPWVEHLPGGGFIANCGASGFAGNPLYSDVHYLLVQPFRGRLMPHIERAAYNAHHWAQQLRTEGVSAAATYPLLKGLPPTSS